MCLKQPSGHKLFLIVVWTTNLNCHLKEVWVVFFSLAQGVHILTVCQSCSYPWSKPSPSKYIASSLSFLCSCFPTPCAEREMLPDRDLRLRDGCATSRESALTKSSSVTEQGDRYCGALLPVSQPDLQLHCRRDRLKSEPKHSWDFNPKVWLCKQLQVPNAITPILVSPSEIQRHWKNYV